MEKIKYVNANFKNTKNQMKSLIETFKSDGKPNGYCVGCNKYFKKNDWIIVFEKVKVYKITRKKICVFCYLSQIATRIGWKKIINIINKSTEKNI